ncbi:unnamed protein product, partial [Gulo gulo]
TISICVSVVIWGPPSHPLSSYTDYHNRIDISQELEEQPFKAIKESMLL